MKFTRRTILLIFLILAILVLFLPIKVYYSFESTAVVYPSQEWTLKRGADDSYISELQDYKTNAITHLKSYKFERGDIAEVHLKPGLKSNDFIKQTDTIGFIHSFYIENEISRLENLREVEEASLNAHLTGEKQSLIDQAEKKLEFARQQLSLEKKKYDRQLKLFSDSIISPAQFEGDENDYRLAEINVEISDNELDVLRTGQKSEDIKYIQQVIDSYSREIETLKNQKQHYFIQSPIDGVVSFNNVEGNIVNVSDTSQYILKIPVKVNNIPYLNKISGIRFSIPGYTEETDASFINLDETVNIRSNQQMVIAKALVNRNIYKVYPGMAVQCKVICDEITIFTFLKRGIHLRL